MSRKYRQRGYQDEERSATARPPRRAVDRDGPRGRGLGKPTATRVRCARCGTEIADPEIARDAVCRGCGADLHACVNCRHFDTAAPLECRKPIEARIASKSSANDCSWFSPRTVQEFASESSGEPAGDAKAAFDDLFDF